MEFFGQHVTFANFFLTLFCLCVSYLIWTLFFESTEEDKKLKILLEKVSNTKNRIVKRKLLIQFFEEINVVKNPNFIRRTSLDLSKGRNKIPQFFRRKNWKKILVDWEIEYEEIKKQQNKEEVEREKRIKYWKPILENLDLAQKLNVEIFRNFFLSMYFRIYFVRF